jgi:hypothetical protein
MSMTTTMTFAFEGPDSCLDCQRAGIPTCTHIGFSDAGFAYVPRQRVRAPGLDNAYDHIVRSCAVSPDRKTVTLVVVTERPQFLDLARHLSVLGGPKAAVRAVHHETGEVLEEGRYDWLLQTGQQVHIDTDEYRVVLVEHPNRNEFGVCEGTVDLQVAHLKPVATPPVQPVAPVDGGAHE